MSNCMEEVKNNVTQESSTDYLSPDKTFPRRKSSIFNRKSFCTADTSYSVVNDETDIESVNAAAGNDLDVDAYVQSLKNEIANWKTLYKERKQSYKGIKRKLKTKSYCDNVDMNDFLTEEDKKFLDERPDYDEIGKKAIRSIQRLVMCQQEVRETEKSTLALIEIADKASFALKKIIVDNSCML